MNIDAKNDAKKIAKLFEKEHPKQYKIISYIVEV